MEDAQQPATKQAVADLRVRRQHVKAMREVQKELVKAFNSYAESNRQAVLITRISLLEDRMLALERKVNFPNQPQRRSPNDAS